MVFETNSFVQQIMTWRNTLIFILSFVSSSLYCVSPYSTSELEELEKEFKQLINQSNQIERNPLASQYINSLGKKITRSPANQPFYFFIVKSSEINAFAGPGGYIGINSQLILATENESELASVIAHEIAHVHLHHLYQMIEHEKQMRIPMLASLLASAALGAINGDLASGAMMATMTEFSQNSINFTRSNEKEADRIGINMLINAGFNPQAMASFFKKMQQHSRYYFTANIPAFLRTHPLDEERIAEAENRCAQVKITPLDENPNYALFKELIRVSVSNDKKQLLDFYKHQCKNTKAHACQYGHTLTLLALNQFKEANAKLSALLTEDPENIFYQIAAVQAANAIKNYAAALDRLASLYKSYPENYAVIRIYGQSLMAAEQPKQAINILLKGFRRFKNDLPLCKELAQAHATTQQKAFAYFTEAQCEVIQGHHGNAIQQLNLAKNIAKQDQYLQARIKAKIEEIRFLYQK